MESAFHGGTDWRALFGRTGFRYIFIAMFVSLFGTGMNFAGTTWYILEKTNSTLQVSFMVILVTLPGLIVPPFGGVLIDRVDRRYLGTILDLLRGATVLGTAALLYWGRAEVWHIYAMVMMLGIGAAMYWSTLNALVQEVVREPGGEHAEGQAHHRHFAGANAAVLIAVQSGMVTAGAVVGFLYEHTGLAGILAIDGATYLVSALCLIFLREGYHAPAQFPAPAVSPPTIEAPPASAADDEEEPVLPPIVEPGLVMGFVADLHEGLRYLKTQPRVFALGFTYACMMAGVISANVLVVVLSRDVLNSGPRGFGFMESGWAIGAVTGGLITATLVRRHRALNVLVAAMTILAIGHAVFPLVGYLAAAVAMNALMGGCRALGGVVTQTSIMHAVPPRLMGRTLSTFSVISTLLQVAMSFSLGYLAQQANLYVAFGFLAMLYGGAAWAAVRARALSAVGA